MTDRSADTGKAFILGLDGVPWPLLTEWIDDGQLPNFRRMFENGATGPLESSALVTTPVAWPSIFTGVRADKHGIYAFHRLTSSHTRELNNTGIDQPKLWDLLSPAVVSNVPMTYPATEMDGKLVAGMLSPSIDADFTHPPELADDINERVPEYEIGHNWHDYHDDVDGLFDDLAEMVSARRKLTRLLMETTDDWRLFFTVFTAPDRLQHLCWDRDVLLDHYEILDDLLGDVMAYVEEHDATLYVVSDHGFEPADRFVYPNAILADEGLLTPKGDDHVRGAFDRIGLSKSTVLDALDRIGIDEQRLVQLLPESVVHLAGGQLPGDHSLYDVKYDETVAFANAFGTVYVNDSERFDEGIVDPADVDDVKAEVTAAMESVRDPETEEAVLTVRDGDDLFPRDDDSPDLVVESADGYNVKQSLADDYFGDTGSYVAGHQKQGIFLAWGAHVDQGAQVSGAHVTDVAPTVLHGAGAALPAHLDGDVLDEVFAADSPPANTAIGTVSCADEDGSDHGERGDEFDGVEERLKGLGYME